MGFGKIGSGVYEHLRDCEGLTREKLGEPVFVKYALDAARPPGLPDGCVLTNDINVILNDASVKVAVETMGGLQPAFSYASALLGRGVSVVTSNKELVAEKGGELFRLAEDSGSVFLFEASVGGGIPVIAALGGCFLSDEITEISAILNGTTNYILTRMAGGGVSFETALGEAKANGFAEKNPDDDINGADSARKIAILASVASGLRFDSGAFPTEGIAGVTQGDINCAGQIGAAVKLAARWKKTDAGFEMFVGPVIAPLESPLGATRGVTNCVLITGKKMGSYALTGPGAGKEPTASAVVSDIIRAAQNAGKRFKPPWGGEAAPVLPPGEGAFARLARVRCENAALAKAAALEVFGAREAFGNGGEIGVLTPPLAQSVFDEKMSALLKKAGEASFVKSMRVI